jgi:hypothetical protein
MLGTYHKTAFLGPHPQRRLRRHPHLRLLDKKGKPAVVKNPMPKPGTLFALRDLSANVMEPPLRLYRVGDRGEFRARGVEASAFQIMSARSLPRLTIRRLNDRSKYSPNQCQREGCR